MSGALPVTGSGLSSESGVDFTPVSVVERLAKKFSSLRPDAGGRRNWREVSS